MTAQSKIDHRHLHRAKLMQALFARTFNRDWPDQEKELVVEDQEFSEKLAQIEAELDEIDALLQKHAPERPLTEINQVDLAILRLILFEFNHSETPRKVLIDEAVELAKEYGSESSPRFVNGVLGKLLIEEDLTRESDQQPDEVA